MDIIDRLIKVKCEKCGKLLFEGLFRGVIVKICPRCKHKNIIKK